MKEETISLGISLTLIALSIGVVLGNEHLLNYLLFASMVLLPLAFMGFAGAFYVALKAEQGDKECIEIGRKYVEGNNRWLAQIFLVSILTATGTALYYGWIMTAVMFVMAEIITRPAKGLMQRAARCEPSFGDETIDALREDAHS